MVFDISQFALSCSGLAGKLAAALACVDLGTRSSKPPLHNISPGTHICHTMSVRKATITYVLTICVSYCCALITVGRTPC